MGNLKNKASKPVASIRTATLILLGAVTAAWAFDAKADHGRGFKVGSIYPISAFCTDEKSAKKLSVVMALEGVRGYLKAMADGKIGCFNLKDLPGAPPVIPITILKREWKVIALENTVIQFYKVKSTTGKIGYSWGIEPKAHPKKRKNGAFDPKNREA